MQDAVGNGLTAIVPGVPTAAQAWWTVDPADGSTRSILDPGLGAGRGAGNKDVNSSKGGTHYVDEQGNSWVRKTSGPPSRCKGGQEYTILLGCVSVPAAWAMRGVYAVVGIVATYAMNALYQSAIGR